RCASSFLQRSAITATSTLSLHDALPISLYIAGDVTLKEMLPKLEKLFGDWKPGTVKQPTLPPIPSQADTKIHLINRPGSVQTVRSEEHTSELQSRFDLVCRLLLEKKKYE